MQIDGTSKTRLFFIGGGGGRGGGPSNSSNTIITKVHSPLLVCLLVSVSEEVAPLIKVQVTMGPLTLKFDRATRLFLKFDRRHWTILKLTGKFQK